MSVIVDNDPTNKVASIELRVSSDAGNEDLVLTESDAWLHGAAALAGLPVKDAALTLTLYDKGSASLMSFSGTLATDGAVSLTADATKDTGDGGSCDVRSRTGCTVTTTDSSATLPDVEVLAAEVYPSGKGYALTLDLAGADTYEVAYAAITVTESDEVTTCSKAGGCTTTGSTKPATAEVDWDAVGSVWEAESTLDHTGVIDVKAKTRDASGNTLENVKAELAEPWLDDGDGVNALSAGSGTSVAVLRGRWDGEYDDGKQPGTWSSSRQMLTAVSDGWTTTEYPTHAELELAGGGTVLMPANSYQRVQVFTGNGPVLLRSTFRGCISISKGDLPMAGELCEPSTPLCSSGTCVVLVEGEEGYELSFTAYGQDPGKLPEKQDFSVVLYDKEGTKVASETISVEFDAEVTAVFASELEIDGDPIGGDASGSVSLLGAADEKGKQATLSKGTFYGSFSRESDGDLALGGYGTDEWATSESSASVLLGDPVGLTDGDGTALRPPVIRYWSHGIYSSPRDVVCSTLY